MKVYQAHGVEWHLEDEGLLEIVQGNRPQTEQSLLADPNHDGHLTTDDVLSILRSVVEQ